MMTDALELGGDLHKKPDILALRADIAGNECLCRSRGDCPSFRRAQRFPPIGFS
jgi:hypothetical protein